MHFNEPPLAQELLETNRKWCEFPSIQYNNAIEKQNQSKTIVRVSAK